MLRLMICFGMHGRRHRMRELLAMRRLGLMGIGSD
jgi:hypothetical protein